MVQKKRCSLCHGCVAAHESTDILNQVVVLPRFVKTDKLRVLYKNK